MDFSRIFRTEKVRKRQKTGINIHGYVEAKNRYISDTSEQHIVATATKLLKRGLHVSFVVKATNSGPDNRAPSYLYQVRRSMLYSSEERSRAAAHHTDVENCRHPVISETCYCSNLTKCFLHDMYSISACIFR